MNLSELVPRPVFLPGFTGFGLLRGLSIAVTGHRGLLGSLLLARLDDWDIPSAAFLGDITNPDEVLDWIKSTQPDVLFHLAAVVPLNKVRADPIAAMRTNATSLLTISEAITTFSPRCWVFLGSTSHVYAAGAVDGISLPETAPTSPSSLYGATKLAGERIMIPLAEHLGTQLCVGRIFSFFHERQPVAFLIPGMVQRIQDAQDGGTIEIHDADCVRDFLHADMVVDAILHLCAKRHAGIVNIGSGAGTSVGDIVDRIIALSGRSLSVNCMASNRPNSLIADVERLRSVIEWPEVS